MYNKSRKEKYMQIIVIILSMFLLFGTVSAEPSLLGEWEGYWNDREDMKVSMTILKISSELVEPEPPRLSDGEEVQPQEDKPQIVETAKIQYIYRYGQFEKDVKLTRNGITKFLWFGKISVFIKSLNRNEAIPFIISFEFDKNGKLTGTYESRGSGPNRIIGKIEMKKIR